MELAIKYGPHILGLFVAILGMIFFMVRFLLGRVYGGMDTLFKKHDELAAKVQRLETSVTAMAAKDDNTIVMRSMMGGDK